MFTLEEIMNMSPEELSKNWTEVCHSSLVLLGDREMTQEEMEQTNAKLLED